ncbi:hypothetical protein ACJ41O_013630 [Fusarium nematophilum]
MTRNNTTPSASTPYGTPTSDPTGEPVITNILVNGDFDFAGGATVNPWTSDPSGGTDYLYEEYDGWFAHEGQALGMAFPGVGPEGPTLYYIQSPVMSSRIVPDAEYALSAWVWLDTPSEGGFNCRSVEMHCVYGGLLTSEGGASLTDTGREFRRMRTTCRWTREQAWDRPKVLFVFECGISNNYLDTVELVGPMYKQEG